MALCNRARIILRSALRPNRANTSPTPVRIDLGHAPASPANQNFIEHAHEFLALLSVFAM
jgi:hypothetical protein